MDKHSSSLLLAEYSEPLSISAPIISSAELRTLIQHFSQWQQDAFNQLSVATLVNARAEFVDLILIKLWCQHHLDEYQISLLAVGGYGRGELHPYSDIDLLLLTQENIDTELEDKISSFITQLWDIKFEIGQSVRSVEECVMQAEGDITIATNLMEMRQISGNSQLPKQLDALLNESEVWTSEKFFIAKRDEQNNRHKQYHGASYTLEPNLKANPGGLRDIQTVGWVAKRHFKADFISELVEHEYLTRNEHFEMLECQDFLWRMRFALHIVAKRSENRLLFDYQADVSKVLGFGDEGKPAIERMMKRFFRIISRVSELNQMLLQHFEDAILKCDEKDIEVPINDDFVLVNGRIKAVNDHIFMYSIKIMELFLIIAKTPEITDLHPETLRLMRNARRRLVSGLNDYAACRKMFLEIMKHPRGMGLAFTLMHKHSIIGAYLPEWRNILGQMQFDLFHAYSVDEHSYRLIKNLYRFSQPEFNHEFPLCSKIVQRIRKPELLYLAGIFHDIAKGRGGDHAKLGAVDALNFSKTHQLSLHDGRMIAWLVRQHLTMSITAQRRDIADPAVIAEFAELVRDEAHLDYLYCLTVADMRATNESLWNAWKGNLLEELYFNTKRAFRRGLEKPVDLRAKIRENKQQALEILLSKSVDDIQLEKLWKDFKADYFLRHSPEQIAWHCENILKRDKNKPLVLLSPIPYRGGTEVFVYTKAKTNIFSRTVSLLETKKLSILDAKIITSRNGYTLNTFIILDLNNKPIDDTYHAIDISESLMTSLSQKNQKSLNSAKRSRKLDQFNVKTEVSFIESTSQNNILMEITALDHPGLLARFAQVFQDYNINIHSAKITTFGEKAEDVFTVSNHNNKALTLEEQEELRVHLCDESPIEIES